MPLIAEFDYSHVRRLQTQFIKILEHLSGELERLQNSSNRFKAQLNDRTSTEALKIINDYKTIIRKMNETFNESLTAVRNAADKFAYIEEVLASELKGGN